MNGGFYVCFPEIGLEMFGDYLKNLASYCVNLRSYCEIIRRTYPTFRLKSKESRMVQVNAVGHSQKPLLTRVLFTRRKPRNRF